MSSARMAANLSRRDTWLIVAKLPAGSAMYNYVGSGSGDAVGIPHLSDFH